MEGLTEGWRRLSASEIRRVYQVQTQALFWGEAGVLDLEWAHLSWLPLFQGSSVCQVTAIGVTVILLYASRACYNLFILSFSQSNNVHSFDYDWYNVSDQVSGGP